MIFGKTLSGIPSRRPDKENMRKSIKVMIASAGEVVKIWKETTMIMDPNLEIAIEKLEDAIKHAKGEV